MNETNKQPSIFAPIAALGLTCLIVTALLAVTNFFTAPIIAEQSGDKANAARLLVLPEGEDFALIDLPEGAAESGVTEIARAGNGAGYTVTVVTPGYHGDITAMFGIGPDGKISGVEVLEHTETQGLGERIVTPEFRQQFAGKSGVLNLVKGGANTEQDIEALAGATVSSTAMTNAANAALAAYEQSKEVS